MKYTRSYKLCLHCLLYSFRNTREEVIMFQNYPVLINSKRSRVEENKIITEEYYSFKAYYQTTNGIESLLLRDSPTDAHTRPNVYLFV